MKSKYVIFDNSVIMGAIIFPDYLNHSDFKTGYGKIISAGFVEIAKQGDNVPYSICYGRSQSLNLDSKTGDNLIVDQTLRIGKFYR